MPVRIREIHITATIAEEQIKQNQNSSNNLKDYNDLVASLSARLNKKKNDREER